MGIFLMLAILGAVIYVAYDPIMESIQLGKAKDTLRDELLKGEILDLMVEIEDIRKLNKEDETWIKSE